MDAHLRRIGATGFAAQMVCFVSAALLLGWGRGWKLPRISDPGVLVLVWCACYLIYPSGVWLRGGLVPFGEHLIENGGYVLLAQGIFVLSLMVALLWASGRRSCGFLQPLI